MQENPSRISEEATKKEINSDLEILKADNIDAIREKFTSKVKPEIGMRIYKQPVGVLDIKMLSRMSVKSVISLNLDYFTTSYKVTNKEIKSLCLVLKKLKALT